MQELDRFTMPRSTMLRLHTLWRILLHTVARRCPSLVTEVVLVGKENSASRLLLQLDSYVVGSAFLTSVDIPSCMRYHIHCLGLSMFNFVSPSRLCRRRINRRLSNPDDRISAPENFAWDGCAINRIGRDEPGTTNVVMMHCHTGSLRAAGSSFPKRMDPLPRRVLPSYSCTPPALSLLITTARALSKAPEPQTAADPSIQPHHHISIDRRRFTTHSMSQFFSSRKP
ncbi:hypothetical protein LZ32DRAFT_200353 [Colletotrichum eremochloae]|nr:hypothetical protein LZ32DRAFT_200353 [Colletotrichum eremochloae]